MGPLLRNQDLIKSLISPYISDMPATQPREINPATCSASMISLVIGVTAIAEGAMSLRLLTLLALKLDTTISSDSNLCIVQCCCFFDLSLDEIEGVHSRSPKRMGFTPRSFSRLRPSNDYTQVQIPLRSLLVLPQF